MGSSSRRQDGLGLGLVISLKLARLLGGDITVESELGQGCKFCLTIPLSKVEPLSKPVQTVKFALSSAGATVQIASNGKIAMEMVVCLQKEGRQFDAIIMDMQMPELDGHETTKKLQSIGIKTPILALTASAMDSDRIRCLAADCDEYVTKPIDLPRLVQLVAKHAVSGDHNAFEHLREFAIGPRNIRFMALD